MSEFAWSGSCVNTSTGKQEACELRRLTDADVDSLCELHALAYNRLENKGLMYQRTRQYLAESISKTGETVGIFAGPAMVGYSTLQWRDPRFSELAPLLRLTDQSSVLAEFGGSAIHPDYRGNRLSFPMAAWRMFTAKRHGCGHLAGLVAVSNASNLAVQTRAGLFCKALHHDADGPNFVLHADLMCHGSWVMDPDSGVCVALDDLDGHVQALAQGLWGYAIRRKEGSFHLEFGRFSFSG